MVVLLEELVFAFAGLVGDDLPAVAELSSALLLRQAVEPVDFSLLLLEAEGTQQLPLQQQQLRSRSFHHETIFRDSDGCSLTLLGPLCPV